MVLPLPANLNITSEQEGDPLSSTTSLSIVMSLSYVAVGTRPDLSFAVNFLACFLASPGPSHWKGVWNLVIYLTQSKDQVLVLKPNKDEKPLKCYCDVSWGGEHAKSTYGVFVTFLGCLILWLVIKETGNRGSINMWSRIHGPGNIYTTSIVGKTYLRLNFKKTYTVIISLQ
jgi:hypothetical protein